MKIGSRDGCIQFIAHSCCDNESIREHYYDRLVWAMSEFDDETLADAAIICGNYLPLSQRGNKADLMRQLIICEETADIRLLAIHHRDLIENKFSLDEGHLLLSTLTYLEVLDEDSHYPHLKAHAELSSYSSSSRIPYHQNDELVRLVHDHPDLHEEIVNLIHVEGMTDIGLVREHLLNAAPALAEGIL